MAAEHHHQEQGPDRLPPAETGNASNPSPEDRSLDPQKNQLIDERGEKYLREVASPEDYPDPQDEADADAELGRQA